MALVVTCDKSLTTTGARGTIATPIASGNVITSIYVSLGSNSATTAAGNISVYNSAATTVGSVSVAAGATDGTITSISAQTAFQSGDTTVRVTCPARRNATPITLSIRYASTAITWSSAGLTLSQATTSRAVTATRSGTASSDVGTITYYLYEGSTLIGTFSGTTMSFTPSAGAHTYTLKAGNGYTTADGKSTSITVVEPAITWSSASLTLSQATTSTNVTATRGGTATHSRGEAVTYYLYEGSTSKGAFSGTSMTLSSVSAGSHTYKTVAVAGGLSKDGASKSITVVTPAITWSNATLSLSQATTSRSVTATMGGSATHSRGETVTYKLYEGSTVIGTFSNSKVTFTPSAGSHTYKTVAVAGGLTKDGKSASITVVEPAITWSNATLTLVQATTSRAVTATMGGSATHSRGETVTYKLYEGSTVIGTFSNSKVTFTPTAGSHTYKTVAVAGGLTKDGKSTSITVVEPAITWSNATLTLVQATTSRAVTATMGGSATHSRGETVTYKLYEGTTAIGTFANNVVTFTPTAGSHTYKSVAIAGGLSKDGKSTSITVIEPAINWTDPTLTLVQETGTLNITATKGGSAVHTRGETVTYYLYEGSTQIDTFSGDTVTFASTVGSHTYKVIASAGGLTSDGASATIDVGEPSSTVKYYDGTEYIECKVYCYDGTEFVECDPYYYDGSDWVLCSH